MNEIWKKVNNDLYYEVSNYGRVRETITQRIILQFDNGRGYQKVSIPTNEVAKAENGTTIHNYYNEYNQRLKVREEYVHRLVALAFIDNPDRKPQVDHINTDRGDNRAENLRWVTQSENNLNPITSQRMKDSFTTERRQKAAEKMKETNKYLKRYTGQDNPFSKKFKGTHYYNNGQIEVREKTCPEGFVKGRLKKEQ